MAAVRVFVSHSHQDNEWCRPMVAALKAVGYDVWYDETGLKGGAAWVAEIQREVQARDVFLLVLTPEAWASQWVQDELQLAIATRRRILPVLLRNTQVDGFILTIQWVTVIGEEPQTAARAIIKAIESPPAPGRDAVPRATETLDGLITLCKSLQAEQRYTEALSACDRALALNPDVIEILCTKGAVLDRIGQQSSAAAVFAHALFLLLDPVATDSSTRRSMLDSISEMSDYVFVHSDDPETIVRAYRQVSRTEIAALMERLPSRVGKLTGASSVPGGNPRDELPVVINHLSDLGAKDAIAALASEYDGSGRFVGMVFNSLAHAGLVDSLLQLCARLGMDGAAFLPLYESGHVDAAMSQAAKVVDDAARQSILTSLVARKQCETTNRLCRQWFGYPPSHLTASYSNAISLSGSLGHWSRALEELGLRHEAAVVSKHMKRLLR